MATKEPNNFGLVSQNSDGSATLAKDYPALQKQYSKLNFTEVQGQKPGSSSAGKPPVCSPKLITTKGFNNNFTLPVPPPGAQDIIDNGVQSKRNGRLVDIKDWSVKATVKDADGKTIAHLAVQPLADDQINHPGTNTEDGTTGSGTTSSPASETSKNAAARPGVVGLVSLAVGALGVVAGVAL